MDRKKIEYEIRELNHDKNLGDILLDIGQSIANSPELQKLAAMAMNAFVYGLKDWGLSVIEKRSNERVISKAIEAGYTQIEMNGMKFTK